MSFKLSVVVVFHNMQREAPRTLHTLSRAYQRGIADLDYEVIAVDNGSTRPLDADSVRAFGPEFRYLYNDTRSVSPAGGINRAAAMATGSHLTICIDGARMLSPGVLRHTFLACGLAAQPVVAVLGWHLGPKQQKLAMQEGYDQAVEDRLLDSVDWRGDGYRLFDIACLAGSSKGGWFKPISESNALTVTRGSFEALGGYDEGFTTPGGGLVNLDFYKRACERPGAGLVVLLAEGCFHQYHGGAATNAPPTARPDAMFKEEYLRLRGRPYRRPALEPIYLGTMPAPARRFLRLSVDALEADPA